MAGRVALMLAGIATMALGIDLVVKTNLGNSPISSIPYVAHLAWPPISIGMFMLIWQCVLVLTQIALLRKDFRPIDLLQLPISVFFGFCIDGFVALLAPLETAGYLQNLALLACGLVALAAGITMTVISNTIMNCGEAVVKALSSKSGIKFGTMKVIFDCASVAIAATISFCCLGHLEGVREGTVICAVFTGLTVNLFMAVYAKASAAWTAREKPEAAGAPMAPDSAGIQEL